MMHLKLVGRRAHDRILERFEQAHRMSGGAVRGSELFAMNAIEEVLLWCRTLCDDPASRDSDPRFEAAQRYIRQHLAGYITLPILAAHCRLSVSRLSQLFREHAGTTAIRYIEDLRIARARLLLARTSQTVGRIAEEVGFDNPFYFTLRFNRATGLS
jgi:AraC family transcriptional regulator of arabinose operon